MNNEFNIDDVITFRHWSLNVNIDAVIISVDDKFIVVKLLKDVNDMPKGYRLYISRTNLHIYMENAVKC